MRAVRRIILVLLVLLGYTGCATLTSAKKFELETPVIDLVAKGNDGPLEPQKSFKCSEGAKIGCIQFDQATLGPITFLIKNGKKDETCAKSGTKWVITKVQLTAVEAGSTGKGDYAQPIPDWLSNAFPQLNPETGVVYEADTSFATPWAVIIDLNNHDYTEGVKVLYYKVTATNCESGNTIYTDPMVRNKGK